MSCSPMLTISNRKIDNNSSTFFIAEIGQNHQGDINIAKKLIDLAKQNGADAVKFQKTNITSKFNKEMLNQPYDGINSWGKTYGEHKKHLEFTKEQFMELRAYAIEKNILFSASAMDLDSLDFLQKINLSFLKIGSGEANYFKLIEKAAETKIPLVISTGMQSISVVKKIYEIVEKHHKNFALLYCLSSYPSPLEEINLRVIELYKKEFPDIIIGYSGHELGIDVSLAASVLGAKIIERHITLDKNQKGSDHICSLLPTEFNRMVTTCRDIEKSLGVPIKKFQRSERACFDKLGKSIVSTRFLAKGCILTERDLTIKVAFRKGIQPQFIYQLIGKEMARDVNEDESVCEEDITNFKL